VGSGSTPCWCLPSSRCSSPADGGPHPGVPGQEGGGLRDQDGLLVILIPRPRCWWHRPGVTLPAPWAACPIRAARLLPGPVRLQQRRNNNGSAFAGLNANTLFYNTAPASPCCWAATAPAPGAGHRRLHGRQEAHPPGPAPCPRTADVRALLVSVVLIVGALTFIPAWRWVPSSSICPCTEPFGDPEHAYIHWYRPAAASPLFERAIVGRALWASVTKLQPLHQLKNPVMFTVWVGSVLTSLLYVQALGGHGRRRPASSWPSPSGYGSPCCSPTSPRPWPKAGQGPGRQPAQGQAGCDARLLRGGKYGGAWSRWAPRSCARATWCWWKPATPFPGTAT